MMEKLGAIENKEVQKYTCLFSDSHHKHGAKKQILKAKRLATNKHKERRNVRRQKHSAITIVANKKHIKNLSNKELTNDQINLLTKGLKLIPTPVTKQTQIRQQLFVCQICMETTNTTTTSSGLWSSHSTTVQN